jgi:iron-sulfur cluster assembly accessory protein
LLPATLARRRNCDNRYHDHHGAGKYQRERRQEGARAARAPSWQETSSSAEHESKSYALRIAVQPGGCAGLRYSLYFDDRELDGDEIGNVGGLEVRVDKMSAPYLKGAEVDWVDGLQQSGFTINNPNAKGTCACGDSAQF